MDGSAIRLKSRLPLVMIVLLLFLQIFSPAPPILFVLLTLCGLMAVSYFWVKNLAPQLVIKRQRRYGWAQVGDVVEERFIMDNASFLPVLWAQVRDYSNLPGYSASRAVAIASSGSNQWITRGTCQRRGVYTLGPLAVTFGDPFGLFEVTIRQEHSDTFVVYPAVAALPPLLDPRGLVRGSGRANQRSLELTTNASSVRSYVPGDALNRIHWRTTARRSTGSLEDIYVKEFDLEPSGDLWIILDMDEAVHVGQGNESTEEYGVILAASLANQMLHHNHAVGLVAQGEQPIVIPPGKGQPQLWRILQALAGVRADAEMPLYVALQSMGSILGRGMSAALITPSPDPRWVQELGGLLYRGIFVSALLLDGKTFGGDQDMQGIMKILADLGVPGRVLGKDFHFESLGRRRQQRPEYRVLGTGRVVVVNPGDEEQSRWASVGQ
jgi:uncharacterized protein (DUF58 family)